jgi:hypothetical protein
MKASSKTLWHLLKCGLIEDGEKIGGGLDSYYRVVLTAAGRKALEATRK